MLYSLRTQVHCNLLLLVSLFIIYFSTGFLRAAEITWEFDWVDNFAACCALEGYFTHDSATQTLSDINVKLTFDGITGFEPSYTINEAGAVNSTWLRAMLSNEVGAVGFYLRASDLNPDGSDSTISIVGAGKCLSLIHI